MRRLYPATLGMLAIGAGLVLLGDVSGVRPYEYWREALWIGAFVATLGWVIVRKQPDHSIGHLFSIIGLCAALQLVAGAYATLALEAADGPRGGTAAAWLANLLRQPAVFGFMLLFHLFPTGTIPGPRWRWVTRAAAGAIALHVVLLAVGRGPLEDFPRLDNPLGLVDVAALDVIRNVLVVVFLLGGGLVSLIVRFRRSRGLARQQMKWFVYAAFTAVGGLVLLNVLFSRAMEESPLGFWAWLVLPMSVLVAVVVAILRYRLYDIDRIINRTLVYGAVTALLALAYVAGVVGVGGLVRDVAGEASNSLVVAASTLAVAALFRPARARVQRLVDRRFYRSRYDAIRTVEGFASRLRDEVELDALTRDLLATVARTLKPAHASLWLRR